MITCKCGATERFRTKYKKTVKESRMPKRILACFRSGTADWISKKSGRGKRWGAESSHSRMKPWNEIFTKHSSTKREFLPSIPSFRLICQVGGSNRFPKKVGRCGQFQAETRSYASSRCCTMPMTEIQSMNFKISHLRYSRLSRHGINSTWRSDAKSLGWVRSLKR